MSYLVSDNSNSKEFGLQSIKDNIRNSYEFDMPNYNRYRYFRAFLYETTLDSSDLAVLSETQKPQIEVNIGEHFVSQQVGEFNKHELGIHTSQTQGHNVDPLLVDVVDAHMRFIIERSKENGVQKEAFSQTLSGGFSAIKVLPINPSPMSFEWEIAFQLVWDPTLCGWDPMSRQLHRGDGSYCFELYPKKLDDAYEEFGIKIDNVTFSREIGGFSWYFTNGSEKIVMFADYYQKKRKNKKIVKLSDGQVFTESDYNKYLKNWHEKGTISVPPEIIDSKKVMLDTVCQYIVCGNQIIKEEETSYRYLPIVYMDGNSKCISDGVTGNNKLLTKPYIYNLKGIQKLKNFAVQCLGNELENMIQHKIMVAKEAIPEGYLGAYENFQKANCLVYNAYNQDNPNQPLPQPREIVRTPIPPEITNTITMTDQMAEMVLGNFDASLAQMGNAEVSGKAFQEADLLSNAASRPYLDNFAQCLGWCANIALDLIPKYYKTTNTIPVHTKDGQRYYIEVNTDKSPHLLYDSNALNISVTAGPNTSIQKNRALQQITSLMQVSPIFQEFMNEEGLPFLLKNMDMQGIELLTKAAESFSEKLKQSREAQQGQQQAAQQQMQMEQQKMIQAMQIEMEKLAIEKQSLQQNIEEFTANLHFKIAEMQAKQEQFERNAQLEEAKLITEREKIESDNEISMRSAVVQEDKVHAEIYSKNVEASISIADKALEHARRENGTEKETA